MYYSMAGANLRRKQGSSQRQRQRTEPGTDTDTDTGTGAHDSSQVVSHRDARLSVPAFSGGMRSTPRLTVHGN